MKFFINKKEVLVVILFLIIALFSIALATQLPKGLSGDEVVVLLSDKLRNNTDFPDANLLSSLSFDSYLYPRIISFLSANFSAETYRSFLLFIYVFFTGYCSYLALRILKFSRATAIAVAVIALMPRVSPGATFFGVFTHYENLGRSMSSPIIWLLAAYNIKFLSERKNLYWLFFVAGLLVYIHPVTMIFFSALLFIISFFWLFKDRGFKTAILNTLKSVVAFALGAFFLLKEIITTTASSLEDITVYSASGFEYAQALLYRMPWDFLPETILWLRQVAVISFVFILFILSVIFLAKKKKISFSVESKKIFYWSGLLMFFSVLFSYFLPNIQLYLVRHFDFPFIIQQSSRIFKFYYLGLFLALAVSVEFFRKYFKNRLLFTFIVIIGIVSSSIGFEWVQYLLGSGNYQSEYIFSSWQENLPENKADRYQRICQQLKDAGIDQGDLVISSDFDLRYFCQVRLFVTYEEGSTYLMRGKEPLVYWYNIFLRQAEVLDSKQANDLIDFANNISAQYAVLPTDSEMVPELEAGGLVVGKSDDLRIIKFVNK
ncbi:hypothetical protein C4566_02575 [Candidatus Parcubacteria bacterium]|nr:MAG: hypothetical protein C4566_02575 [Candidatus Parcubacteria bacterium]